MISSWIFHSLEESKVNPLNTGLLKIKSTAMREDIANTQFDPNNLILNKKKEINFGKTLIMDMEFMNET